MSDKINKIFKCLKTYSKYSFKFTISSEKDMICFFFENFDIFPSISYELKINLQELEKIKGFDIFRFKDSNKFINLIQKSIEANKYDIISSKENNYIIFQLKWELFENDVELKIPEKGIDLNLKSQIENLSMRIDEMSKMITSNENNLKNNEKEKNEAAENSFKGTSFLNNDEKKLISKWIHPNKIIKFNLLFTTAKDGDSSSTFHYYCDGAFPTVTVVLDTSGRRFGGYSTMSFGQSSVGASYCRAPGSFIFNLSNQKKYNLNDELINNAIYRHNSYGPTFGGGHDFYISNQCRSNTNSYCSRSSYDTGSVNLLGGSSSTSFQVSYYEVYQVEYE